MGCNLAFFWLLMVSRAKCWSFSNRKKDPEKIHPGARIQGVIKAPDPESATLAMTACSTFFF
jgi:hypothetical protein